MQKMQECLKYLWIEKTGQDLSGLHFDNVEQTKMLSKVFPRFMIDAALGQMSFLSRQNHVACDPIISLPDAE